MPALSRTLAGWIALALIARTSSAQEAPRPYPPDWARAGESAIDLSGFLDAPAGKAGFLRVEGQRLVKPDGSRFRFWGVNLCGPDCFLIKEQADQLVDDLARLGVNCVRLHHMDSSWSVLFDRKRDDTRQLDPESLDRLDYLVAGLKARGIHVNLNLNVGRHFKAGDGVRDPEILGYGKSATYFNPRLIELQREYAGLLLTHKNPYTGNEYRHEPAVATIELVNENSVLEGWVGWRLVGSDEKKPGDDTWRPIPVSYADELTDQYQGWLKGRVPAATREAIEREAGVATGGRVPRLRPDEFAKASRDRFLTEARFYMEVERGFFVGMRQLLKEQLGVRPPIVGTADHNDSYSGYAHIASNLALDFVDGHGYWQHPEFGKQTRIRNTPMVNDPLDSTVVQFARTPVLGRPFTISEVNHPFPHEYACEGLPILTAYALFHDWDGIDWFTWGQGRRADPARGIQNSFDFSTDPVKVASLATCGLMWYRHDVRPAEKTVVRAYTEEQMIESLRMDRGKERPFFTPGFARSTPLEHATRFTLDDPAAATPFPPPAPLGRIVSDTGELAWLGADKEQGLVTVQTERTEALIGFLKGAPALGHITPGARNAFCSLILTSLDEKPIATSRRLLLTTTARASNSGFVWEKDRQTVAEWGQGPALVEPVLGSVTLRGLDNASRLVVRPLSAVGRPLEERIDARREGPGWVVPLGKPTTLWYLIEVIRP